MGGSGECHGRDPCKGGGLREPRLWMLLAMEYASSDPAPSEGGARAAPGVVVVVVQRVRKLREDSSACCSYARRAIRSSSCVENGCGGGKGSGKSGMASQGQGSTAQHTSSWWSLSMRSCRVRCPDRRLLLRGGRVPSREYKMSGGGSEADPQGTAVADAGEGAVVAGGAVGVDNAAAVPPSWGGCAAAVFSSRGGEDAGGGDTLSPPDPDPILAERRLWARIRYSLLPLGMLLMLLLPLFFLLPLEEEKEEEKEVGTETPLPAAGPDRMERAGGGVGLVTTMTGRCPTTVSCTGARDGGFPSSPVSAASQWSRSPGW